MSTKKYDEDFKKLLVTLHQSGMTQSQLYREYRVSKFALKERLNAVHIL